VEIPQKVKILSNTGDFFKNFEIFNLFSCSEISLK
jgi:hypothetical protein